MRTTVSIPDGLLRRAKRVAMERGVTLTEIVVDALRQSLERDSAEAQPGPFELVTFRGSSDWPDLDFDHTSELVAADDEERYRVVQAPAAYRRRTPQASPPGEPAPKRKKRRGGRK